MNNLIAVCVALGAAACSVETQSEDVAQPMLVIGKPTFADYAPGQYVYTLCVLANTGGTIHADMPSEGTIAPTDSPLLGGTPDASCPPAVGDPTLVGYALFHWQTAASRAVVGFSHLDGALTSSSVEVELVGKAFAGYEVNPGAVVVAPSYIMLQNVTFAYVDPSDATKTAPAPHVAFTIDSVPALAVKFPTSMPATDAQGGATIVLARPDTQTAVFVTPEGGSPMLLTTLDPPP